jgi:hypothetical protein
MEKRKVIEKEGAIGLKARTVLWYLTFFGFAINYIIRINTSITIVDMIDMTIIKTSSNQTIVTSECIAERNFTTSPELSNELNLVENAKYVSVERRLLDFLGVSQIERQRLMNRTSLSMSIYHSRTRSSTNVTASSGTHSSNRAFLAHFFGCTGPRSYLGASWPPSTGQSSSLAFLTSFVASCAISCRLSAISTIAGWSLCDSFRASLAESRGPPCTS